MKFEKCLELLKQDVRKE